MHHHPQDIGVCVRISIQTSRIVYIPHPIMNYCVDIRKKVHWIMDCYKKRNSGWISYIGILGQHLFN